MIHRLDNNGVTVIRPTDGQPETISNAEGILEAAESHNRDMRDSALMALGYDVPQPPELAALARKSQQEHARRLKDKYRKRRERAAKRRRKR